MKLFRVSCDTSMKNVRAIYILVTFFNCDIHMFAGPFFLHLPYIYWVTVDEIMYLILLLILFSGLLRHPYSSVDKYKWQGTSWKLRSLQIMVWFIFFMCSRRNLFIFKILLILQLKYTFLFEELSIFYVLIHNASVL